MSAYDEDDDDDDGVPTFESLTLEQRDALRRSIDFLIDIATSGTRWDDTLLMSLLPPRYSDRYDGRLLKRFFFSLISAADRVRNSEPPRSVAEEMALAAIFDHAIAITQDLEYPAQVVDEVVEGLRDFQESLFEDADFESLWDGRMDGLEYVLDAVNLAFSKWFTAFREDRPVHPYVEDTGAMPGS